MARTFAGTTSVQNTVDVGDVTAARFLHGSAWSVFVFFYPTTFGIDQRCIISKESVSGGVQASWRIQTGTPWGIEFRHANASKYTTTGSALSTGTWYLFIGTHAANANSYGWILDMSATSLQTGSGTTAADAGNLTSVVAVGQRILGLFDPFLGGLAHWCYVADDLSGDGSLTEEMKAYTRDPGRMVRIWQQTYGVPFYLQLGFDRAEPDLSGSGNIGDLTGADAVSGDPPILPYSHWLWQATVPVIAAAPAENAMPMAIDHYRRRRTA